MDERAFPPETSDVRPDVDERPRTADGDRPRAADALTHAVEMLGAAAATADAVDLATVHDDDLEGALRSLVAVEATLEALKGAVTASFEARRLYRRAGARSTAAWLRCRAGVDAAGAARQVRRARRLRRLPVARAALAAGEITAPVVDRLGVLDNARSGEALREHEAELVEVARTHRFDEFCRHLQRWELEHDPDGAEPARTRERRLHCSRGFQGTLVIDGCLDPIGGQIVATQLDRVEAALFNDDWQAAKHELGRVPTADELPRTPAQRRADALVRMAELSAERPPDGRGAEPLVCIVTGRERFERACELLDGTPLTDGELAGRLPRGVIQRIGFDGDDQPITASRQRSFRGTLRRAIKIRDRECQAPNCDVPASRCEVDHVVPWEQGGPTSVDNGRLLCDQHNRQRHGSGPAEVDATMGACDACRRPHGAPGECACGEECTRQGEGAGEAERTGRSVDPSEGDPTAGDRSGEPP